MTLGYGTASLLGTPIPDAPHAVSVTLPTWRDNVGYEEGEPRVMTALRSGYPRFCFHDNVIKIVAYCEKQFAKPTEACLVFPSRRVAGECREFIANRHQLSSEPSTCQDRAPLSVTSGHPGKPAIRIAELNLTPTHNPYSPNSSNPSTSGHMSCTIYAVLFPSSCRATAKQFWQHSGEGISTRFAQHCLAILDANEQAKNFAAPVQGVRGMTNAQYRAAAYVPEKQMAHLSAAVHAAVRSEHDLFVEERYGRNMDPKDAVKAKSTVRQRIAGVLGDSEPLDAADAGSAKEAVGRSVPNIRDSDVYLFPTGMSAIYNTHRLVRKLAEGRKSVQFGFPYIDTLKIQEKIGPGCHFLGFGDQNDIDRLEREILPSETISAVFCELPSNPLLRTPNLIRLRELADQHGFLIVVDETVGNFVNVAAAKWADVLVSSLTKIFSGDSNVMGGSAVISPSSPRYAELSDAMSSLFEDTLWFEDAIFLERNSRTFIQRIRTINTNAEYLCHYLRSHPKVQEVHYPKYVDTQLYELLSRPLTSGEDKRGFGGLFSLIMGTDEDARNLFDSLEIAKGPSLGTNFTLACPYTILAHYTELDWAAKYNVPARLIRVSVGLESKEDLVSVFEKALASLSPTPV